MSVNDSWKRRALFFGVLAVLIACGTDRGLMSMVGDAMIDAGSALSDASRSDAAAQPVTGCRQWEITVWSTEDCAGPDSGVPFFHEGRTCEPPAGWEPYAGDWPTGNVYLHLRRCISP